MSNMTVLYHANCPDGHASAFACWQQFGNDATYIPVFYSQEPPSIPDDHNIYIVDFSYDEATLKRLLAARIGRRGRGEAVLTILDHHASASRALASLIVQALPGMDIHFDMDECGATLTWKWFHRHADDDAERLEQALPPFFRYVRDRDLWQWKLPDSKPISLAYWALDKSDFLHIEQFAQDLDDAEGCHRIVMQGQAMEAYAAALVKEQAARCFWGEIGGYYVPIVNATTLFSEVGDYLCTAFPAAAFCAYFMVRKDGQWQWGLRGHGKIDLSVVAEQYGGGGHPNASGFVHPPGFPLLQV